MNLKKSLKMAMVMREMDHEGLAERMGIAKTTVGNFIYRNCVTTDTLTRMAKALDMKVSELVRLGED